MIVIKKTSKDIAKICGVSRGTVDRALHGRPGVNLVTKEKILKVAKEHGYRPNFIGRSLVKGKTNTIGIVLFDVHNRIFTQIIDSIEIQARERAYFVNLTLTHKNPDTERECMQQLVDRQVDGIVLFSVNKGADFIHFLNDLRVPIVTFGNFVSTIFPHVWINDHQAMSDAVHYLYAQQYRHIVFVCPPLGAGHSTMNVYVPRQRYKGLQAACAQKEDLLYTLIDKPNYLEEAERILFGSNKKTAFLCTSDIYALNVLNHCKEKKIQIPAQAGIMGFDNIDTLQYVTPSITTISYSTQQIGTEIVNHLIHLIKNKTHGTNTEFRPTICDHAIIEGETT